MAVFVQLRGVYIRANSAQTWFVWGFPSNTFVQWQVRPYNHPNVPFGFPARAHVERVMVEQGANGTYTHFVTVRNDSIVPIAYDLLYNVTWF